MTAYIHADVLEEYAKDAAISETPWEGWEWRARKSMGYFHCGITHTPGAYADYQYRRIKKTKTVMCRAYVYAGRHRPEIIGLLESSHFEVAREQGQLEGTQAFIRWAGDWFPVEVEA